MTQTTLELDDQALESLVARATEAKAHGLALSADDTQLLLDALLTLANLQERLSDKNVTLHKLRKLLGIEKSTEKLSGRLNAGEDEQGKQKNKNGSNGKRAGLKKTPPCKPVKPEVKHHKLDDLSKYEPVRLLRVTGSTSFQPVEHLSEHLRCNACGQYFTAELPTEVKVDGTSDQNLLGMPITASTVFDQCEYLSNHIHPVFNLFKRLAADAIHFHIDDTGNRILDQKPIKKKRRNSNKEHWGQEKLANGVVEENSELGKAIRYFDNNYDGLIQFCVTEGARLDNNTMEQQIKLIVRNRKNASFFKTSVGADVGDVITSIIATVARAGVNLFDYLNVIQRNAQSVKENPELWSPWCYCETLKSR